MPVPGLCSDRARLVWHLLSGQAGPLGVLLQQLGLGQLGFDWARFWSDPAKHVSRLVWHLLSGQAGPLGVLLQQLGLGQLGFDWARFWSDPAKHVSRNLAKDGSWKNQEKSKLLMELLSADHGALSWRRAWQGQTKTWPSQSLAGQNQAAEAGRPADMFDR
ncbi:unnamed protein product [Lupinus luteus]|uniref:Uncharacterized protein n=1 Tax=Lupinus luteus TaxID=3873 RepID=A0AAV1YNE3_LUPLU